MKNTKTAPVEDHAQAENESEWQRGPLSVAEDLCEFAADRSRAKVVIACSDEVALSAQIELLGSTSSRNLALAYAAAHGVGDARQNGNIEGPYACNEDGTPLDEVSDDRKKPLPPKHPKMQVSYYRVDVPVCRKLV